MTVTKNNNYYRDKKKFKQYIHPFVSGVVDTLLLFHHKYSTYNAWFVSSLVNNKSHNNSLQPQ
jgi:hypothetical protein